MKKIMIYIAIGLIAVILVVLVVSLLNPLRKPDEKIRDDILKITPIGMNMEEVLKVIENKKSWRLDYVNDDGGYTIYGQGGAPDIYVGDKSIEAQIGTYIEFGYGMPFRADVITSWGFDKNLKLVNLQVITEIDGL